MAVLHLDDVELHYESHGTGPAIIFIHGSLGNGAGWWQQVPSFADRYTCILVDQRGFGRSRVAHGAAGFAALPDDLSRLLDHLNLERVALVGQSMGGWVCLDAALRRPDRIAALVLADTHARIADAEVAEIQRRRRLAGEVPESLHARALGPDFPLRDPARTFLYFQLAGLNPQPPIPGLADYFSPGVIGAEALASFAAPTLFVVGEQDVGTPPAIVRRLAAHVPGAAVEVIADAGHSAYFEQPAAFNASVGRFLDGVFERSTVR